MPHTAATVLAWIFLTLGALTAVPSLANFVARQVAPKTPRSPLRARQWHVLRETLLLILLGVTFLGIAIGNQIVQYAALIPLLVLLFARSVCWLRARTRAKEQVGTH